MSQHERSAVTTGAADELDGWLAARARPVQRPFVTLSFAQSLDGSIALEPGRPLLLSGCESQAMTHRLRGWHDGILVGIGTVLSDDPQLTVRLVSGRDPQAIVVDSQLRMPLDARLLANDRKPWILASSTAAPGRRAALEARGARVIEVPRAVDGLDLCILLSSLRQQGIERLMVEGGARILSAFLRARLADAAIVTIAPSWVGGLPGVCRGEGPFPTFRDTLWKAAGCDMVLCAALEWR